MRWRTKEHVGAQSVLGANGATKEFVVKQIRVEVDHENLVAKGAHCNGSGEPTGRMRKRSAQAQAMPIHLRGRKTSTIATKEMDVGYPA